MQAKKPNLFISNLCALCADDMLVRKLLLAPSLRVGHQWLETITRSGQPILNLQMNVLEYLVCKAVSPELAKRGLTLLRRRQHELLIDRIFTQRPDQDSGYFSRVNSSRGMTQLLAKAIDDLRLTGLKARNTDAFEVEAKGSEIKALLRVYESELARLKLVDYAGVLGIATELLQSKGLSQFEQALILLPEDRIGNFSFLEREFWNAIPPLNRRLIGVDHPVSQDGEEIVDSQLLSWFANPAEAPQPKGDGSAEIFRAVGEVNEVREVLRRCLAKNLPFDEVEILHTDAGTYPSLIFEIASRLFPEEIDNLPITFSEGLPADCFHPGRALRAWVAWVQGDFPQAIFVEMLQDRLLEIPGPQGASACGRLGALARSLDIGRGKGRYLNAIERRIASLERRIKSRQDSMKVDPDVVVDDDDHDRDPDKAVAKLGQEAAALNLIREVAKALLSSCPAEDANQAEVLAGAINFMNNCVSCIGRLDNYSREKLTNDMLEMKDCIEESEGDVSFEIWEWLAEISASARVGGERPRPGCIHMDSIFSGGHSARTNTFILGMDDKRFPGTGLQDPLLLDAERKRLSDNLPTAAGRLAGKLSDFADLLARLRGKITLSYCCRDLVDDREVFPSSAVFSSCRILSQNLTADQNSILNWIGPPVSFAPQTPENCLDLNEWWLWRSCVSKDLIPAKEQVGKSFPNLAQGLIAAEARESERFTEYDGYVPEAGDDLDFTKPGGHVLSNSQLETFGRCPMEYFCKYILNIHPPDLYQYEPNLWLDPLRKGLLLHSVYCEFIVALLSKEELPEYQRHWGMLEEILDRQMTREEAKSPPPNQEVFRREGIELRRTVEIFLREEEIFCKDSIPVCLEAAIGMPSEGKGGFLDSESPVEITLPGKVTIRIKGRIDRLDCKPGSKNYSIWDYKSGSPWKYEQNPPFNQGRIVQNALYLAMVQARLRDAGIAGAAVDSFGYVFHSLKEFGKRISWKAEELSGGMEIIAELCSLLTKGCFPVSNDANDLKSYEYTGFFGDEETAAKQIRVKLENPDNQMLEPMRRLRDLKIDGDPNAS